VAYREGQAATLRRVVDALLRRVEHSAQKWAAGDGYLLLPPKAVPDG
jgi:hypothetical protein